MSEIKKIARERNMTAREAAKRFGRSPRTIRNLVALDRDVYLNRAAEKRQKVFEMRSTGSNWQEIADAIGTTYGGARSLFYQYIEKQEKIQNEKSEKLETLDLF